MTLPYLTRAGVVTIRFRSIDNSTPKYLSMKDDQSRLFNVNALFTPSDTLVITEGEFDAIIVNDYAGVPAVGVPGVALWQPVYKRLVQGYRTIIVVGDGDEAGEKFSTTLADEIGGVSVVLPDGEDCNSYYMKHDSPGLMEILGVLS
jgi:DNA primase